MLKTTKEMRIYMEKEMINKINKMKRGTIRETKKSGVESKEQENHEIHDQIKRQGKV